MAEKTTYSCDICGIEKRDSNHWWKAVEESGTKLQIVRWNYKIADATPVSHLCGHVCAIKKLSRFMGADSVASTDPIAALAALPIYPLAQESGSQQKEGSVRWSEAFPEKEQQPQWTRDFLKAD